MLRLRELVEPLEALVATDPRTLVSANLRLVVEMVVGVDPDRAGTDRAADAPSPVEALRPHPRGEAVIRGVREGDRLLLVLERLNGQHRTEDLVADQTRRPREILEDRRGHEEAVTMSVAVERLPAFDQDPFFL